MIQDDAALVAQVLAGKKSAFGPLIDRHRPRAIGLARRMLSDPADAEDMVQEALLQAFLCLRDLRSPERFGAWLLGIVVNLCRMRLRARYDACTEVDARPSDALNLALRLKAPIFVTPEAFEQGRVRHAFEAAPTGSGYVLYLPDGQRVQGSELKILLEEWHRKDMEEKGLPSETPEMEYLSFRSLPRGDLGDKLKPETK